MQSLGYFLRVIFAEKNDMSILDTIITIMSYVKQPKKRRLIKEAFKLRHKKGIEIGGPSGFFSLRGGFPVYLFAEKIDNVNYGSTTVFGNYEQGETFNYYKNKIGNQFIAEAIDLRSIKNNSYDFLLSSHSLEHTANPIKALKEWRRVIKSNGKLVLILPDKRYTFDLEREYTSFSHLLDDYNEDTSENDITHIEEILSKYDEIKGKVPIEEYKKLLSNNYINRCAHHHVFNQELIRNSLEFVGFNVESQYEVDPFHLITIATK